MQDVPQGFAILINFVQYNSNKKTGGGGGNNGENAVTVFCHGRAERVTYYK